MKKEKLPSVKELRRMCQLPMSHADTWQDKIICRRFSIYITRLLLPLGVKADQVTFIFMMTGMVAGLFFLSAGKWSYLAGVFTLQLWHILDGVDGEIARFREETSITGIYFDNIIHYIVHPYLFFCLNNLLKHF